MSDTQTKDPLEIHSAQEEDVNTSNKNTNQDSVQCMERGVTNVASSTVSKMFAEVPEAAQSTLFKRKLYTNKTLASKS